MKRRLAVALLVALPGSAALAAPSAEISDFYGRWQGEKLVAPAGLDFQAADLDVRIEPESDGFRVHWIALARSETQPDGFVTQTVDAGFQPTDRPGVFAFRPGGGSLFTSLFAAPRSGNPLEGETLVWARLEARTLVIYSLDIDPDGGFDLDRYARTLADDGMDTRYSRRIDGREPWVIEGRLKRTGQ